MTAIEYKIKELRKMCEKATVILDESDQMEKDGVNNPTEVLTGLVLQIQELVFVITFELALIRSKGKFQYSNKECKEALGKMIKGERPFIEEEIQVLDAKMGDFCYIFEVLLTLYPQFVTVLFYLV